MSEEAVITDRNGAPVDAPEPVPGAPHDPAQPDARRAEPAAQPAPAADGAPATDPEPAYVNPRDAIAKRFQERRKTHESQFMGDHKPPFVEHGERQAEAVDGTPRGEGDPAPPVEPAAAPEPTPAPAAPSGYTLKFRGREMKVASRDELLRLADVEPHEAPDFTDDRLVRLAQKELAASARLEEARSLHDQARVSAPAPAASKASEQQQSEQPESTAKTVEELELAWYNAVQVGSPEDAQKAKKELDAAQNAEAQVKWDAESRLRAEREVIGQHVQQFEQGNPDLAGDPWTLRMVLLAATDEIANDLRKIGATEEMLRPALNDPHQMADNLIQARLAGYSVRSHAELLAAAGAKVRHHMRMPVPPGPAQQPSAAAPTRLDEKRALQAQPVRSGHPAPEPQSAPDIDRSRKNAIDKMIANRRAPNVPMAMAG